MSLLGHQKPDRLYLFSFCLIVSLISGCQAESVAPKKSAASASLQTGDASLQEISAETSGFSGSVGQEGIVNLSWLRDDAASHYEVYRELIDSEQVIEDEKIAETTSEELTDYIKLDGTIYRYRVVSISSENEQNLIAKYLTFDTALFSQSVDSTLNGIVSSVDAFYALENKLPIDSEESLNAEEFSGSVSESEMESISNSANESDFDQAPAAANGLAEHSESGGIVYTALIEPTAQASPSTDTSGFIPAPVPLLSQEEELLQSLAQLQENFQASPHGIPIENWSITAPEFSTPSAALTPPEPELEAAEELPDSVTLEAEQYSESESDSDEAIAQSEFEEANYESTASEITELSPDETDIADTSSTEAEETVVEEFNYSIMPVPSFPGAEGHGATSIGGRGGEVVKVINLNDSGPGSLRAALLMTVPRIIVFDVSGTIALESRIELGHENSYFTLAGQTAPGDGITLRNQSIILSGIEHVVIRYIRIRHGCPVGCNVSVADNLSILSNSSNIMLDHLSMTWAEDEVLEIWGSNINNVTVQWTLMGEGNTKCVDGNSQNLGPLLSGGFPQDRMTFANNYLAHTCYRNYLQDTGEYQFINNLNYNTFSSDFHFSQSQYTGSNPVKSDVVGQFFKEGPQTTRHIVFDVVRVGDEIDNGPWGTISLFLSDIVAVTSTGEVHPYSVGNDPYSMLAPRGLGTEELPIWVARSQPMYEAEFPVITIPAADVPSKVLPLVGSSVPARDSVDERIVNDFYTLGEWSSTNLKRYPQLYTYNTKTDSDNDGMPDEWETAQGLDGTDPSDNNVDSNGDGYTNIETYINSLVPGAWVP